MVGCGGFGAANAGAAIMVLAKALLEFIGVSFPWKVVTGRQHGQSFHRRSVEAADDGRAHGDPSIAVTHVPAVELPVTSSQFAAGSGILQHGSDSIEMRCTERRTPLAMA